MIGVSLIPLRQHSGSDGGRFKALTLFSSTKSKGMFECHQVSRRKLDNDDSLTVNCLKREQEHQEAMSCNGHSMFCSLRVDEFTFAGTHNAGTGQSSRRLPCFFKNQVGVWVLRMYKSYEPLVHSPYKIYDMSR